MSSVTATFHFCDLNHSLVETRVWFVYSAVNTTGVVVFKFLYVGVSTSPSLSFRLFALPHTIFPHSLFLSAPGKRGSGVLPWKNFETLDCCMWALLALSGVLKWFGNVCDCVLCDIVSLMLGWWTFNGVAALTQKYVRGCHPPTTTPVFL